MITARGPTGYEGSTQAVTVTFTLPPGFSYIAGSALGSGGTPLTPSSETSTSVTFGGAGSYHVTYTSHIEIKVAAGTGLGLAQARATVSITTLATSSNTSTATMGVVDGKAPGYHSPTSPAPLTTGNLNLGYITPASNVDYWSVKVTQGDELSLELSNLPDDDDLTLFSRTPQQLQGTPTHKATGTNDATATLTGVTHQQTTGTQGIPLTPPAGYQLYAYSDNRGTTSENIQTAPLSAGTYLVQVSGYNGDSSTEPYLLRATEVSSGNTTTCPGITYPNPTPAPAAAAAIPSNANTLFLVNTQRLTAAYGSGAEATVMTDLSQVASDSKAGVVGAVVPVDSYTTVEAAYSNWNVDPCTVASANDVVSAISKVIDTIRSSHPSITSVVIVGADDQIPFARIADGSTQSNERDYAASTFPGEQNVLADTLGQGYYLSDDPFTATQPLAVGSATLYTPQVAVGRLVETPSQIEESLNRFVTSKGVLDASAALSTGYTFLTQGAKAAAVNLAKVSGRKVAQLINTTWTRTDLNQALTATPAPGLDSINSHFDFGRALPAIGNKTKTQTSKNLFTTTTVTKAPTGTYTGRLLFSMGCHSGLEIDGPELAASGFKTPVADWAKTFASVGALWVGNTGYGYGDTSTIAYSAKLMAGFADNLDGTMSVGAAFVNAKQSYDAGDAVLSPYDLKSLMESTFYGLPMYHLNDAPAPAAAPAAAVTPPATHTDSATGLTASTITFNLQVGTTVGKLGKKTATGGTYYQVNGTNPYDASTQTTEYRPIEPLAKVEVTQPTTRKPTTLGEVAHGALITSLSSTDIGSFTPTISNPSIDSATHTAAPGPVLDPFPAQLQRIATFTTLGTAGTTKRQELDLVAGQFIPDGTSDGKGTQRLFNSAKATVLYTSPSGPLNSDFTLPTIKTVSRLGDRPAHHLLGPGQRPQDHSEGSHRPLHRRRQPRRLDPADAHLRQRPHMVRQRRSHRQRPDRLLRPGGRRCRERRRGVEQGLEFPRGRGARDGHGQRLGLPDLRQPRRDAHLHHDTTRRGGHRDAALHQGVHRGDNHARPSRPRPTPLTAQAARAFRRRPTTASPTSGHPGASRSPSPTSRSRPRRSHAPTAPAIRHSATK